MQLCTTDVDPLSSNSETSLDLTNGILLHTHERKNLECIVVQKKTATLYILLSSYIILDFLHRRIIRDFLEFNSEFVLCLGF